MVSRFKSLKTRTALAVATVIAATLLLNAVYLIVAKRAELRQDIEQKAATFAQLTKAPICVGYENYYRSGFHKFGQLVREMMQLNPDLVRVQVVSVNGEVLFDSNQLGEGGASGSGKERIHEPERIEAIKRLDPTVRHLRGRGGEEMLEIIAPYLEDWGRHRFSVTYQFTYRSLRPKIGRLVGTAGGLTLLAMLASVPLVFALARRITRPVEELTAGAQEIAIGHFERRLHIHSGDELQILAEAFNHMTARLKENVEQLEESNKKLAAVNEELKELDRMKSDLLANVSHELRTPLTAIKGYTDYILERKLGTVTDKQEKGLIVVQRNLERLSRTINALLDFSRMDMGRIALNIQPFALPGLLEQIGTTLRSELDKKRLAFSARVEPDLPPVIADREKLSAVLENLVINAIKFTPEGGSITLSASRAAGAGRPAAEIRVSDTGIGIPRDQLGKIFNRFHQVDGSTTRRFGGVGLGLAIVKSILEAHGSLIAVESEVGGGTVFHFTLPVLEKQDAVHARDGRLRERVEEGLVLLVEEDSEMLRSLRACLSEEGFAVIAAGAADAVSVAATRHPDVILLDPLGPDGSGLQLLPALKRNAATAQVPVLVISVSGDAPRALALGAADVLPKPVDRTRLAAAVRQLLRGLGDAEPLVLVVDDEPDTADLIRDTLRLEGFRTSVAHDGQQALQAVALVRPQLIVLDLVMPGMNGFQVMETLARDAATARIPVLILTGRTSEADLRRGLALGARRFLNKPFEVRELIDEVRRHIGRGRSEATRRASV